MNTDLPLQFEDLQENRKAYIKALNSSEDKTLFSTNNADSLHALGLTMYSMNYSFESVVYNAFATSEIDKTIALHPEQIKIIDKINENKGLIFSARRQVLEKHSLFSSISLDINLIMLF